MANVKKDNQAHKNVMGPVVMGVAGAAAIGATAAVALSNKKVRKQIGRALNSAVDSGKEVFGELQDRVYMQARKLGKRAKTAIEKEKAKTSRRLAIHATR